MLAISAINLLTEFRVKKEDNLFLELASGGSFCEGNVSSWP